MSILFTQYIRPNGQTQHVTIDMPQEIEKMAHELLDHGFHFDIEELQTGMISMTCEHAFLEEMEAAIEVCPNGPEVVTSVENLVRQAYKVFKADPEIPQRESTWRKDLERLEAERKARLDAWNF